MEAIEKFRNIEKFRKIEKQLEALSSEIEKIKKSLESNKSDDEKIELTISYLQYWDGSNDPDPSFINDTYVCGSYRYALDILLDVFGVDESEIHDVFPDLITSDGDINFLELDKVCCNIDDFCSDDFKKKINVSLC